MTQEQLTATLAQLQRNVMELSQQNAALNQTLQEQQTIIQQHQGQIPALNNTLQEQKTLIQQNQGQIRGGALPNPTPKEPKVRLPGAYKGNWKELRGFVNQILMVIRQQPSTYATDEQKVMLVGSLLENIALEWYNPLFESSSPLLASFEEFIEAFRKRFDNPHRAKTARKELEKLKQRNTTAAEYATRFQIVLSDTGYDNEAAIHFFKRGLHDDVQDLLLSMPEEDDLDDLINKAIKADQRIRDRRLDREQPTRPPAPRSDPMIIDATVPGPSRNAPRGPLTAAERSRRIDNKLCLYCGGSGHVVATPCPLLRKGAENFPGRQ